MGAHLVPAVDGLAYGLLLAVVAAGLSLCFGTGGVLNLAHGTMYTLGAYAAALLSHGTWAGLLLALVAGVATGAAAGGLLAVMTAPIVGRGQLAQALLTFGVALAAGDLLVTVFGATDLPVAVPAGLDHPVLLAGHRYPAYRLGAIVVAVALIAGGVAVLSRGRAGALVRAAVDDPQMLACTGVDPRRVHAGVLVGAGALAGLAGVVGAPLIGPGPTSSDTVLLLSLVVVIVGGLGSIPGAVLAAVGVGEVQTLGVTLIPAWRPYLLFAAVALALVVRRPKLAGSVR